MSPLRHNAGLNPTNDADPAAVAEPEAAHALPSAEVMTTEEAAKFLGISSRTLERYVREAVVPYTPLPKRGSRGSVRFLRSHLLKWLQQRTVRPVRWKAAS
jgi:excisionase family DNA binding protein